MHDKCKTPYAAELLLANKEQITPYHCQWQMEDFINRGGAIPEAKLYNMDNSDPREGIDYNLDVHVWCDGMQKTLPAGYVLELRPGESATTTQGLYQQLSAKLGCCAVLLGEVCQSDDDNTDDKFAVSEGSFPTIIEGEPSYWLLCSE
jgi:D-lyxose ketol-isomerase